MSSQKTKRRIQKRPGRAARGSLNRHCSTFWFALGSLGCLLASLLWLENSWTCWRYITMTKWCAIGLNALYYIAGCMTGWLWWSGRSNAELCHGDQKPPVASERKSQ